LPHSGTLRRGRNKIRKRRGDDTGEPLLFPLPPREPSEPAVPQLLHPIWTENKAKLIAKYIYLFELITKHGTYIDGFAGPQQADKPETWAARLVLQIEPRWIRHFYIYESDKASYKLLESLCASQPDLKTREIETCYGDFNVEVIKLLGSGRIGQREATFCLLDQRTFECHWNTIQRIAKYKEAGGNKIELFYFLAASWLRRAISAVKNERILRDWWGRDDWLRLKEMPIAQVKDEFIDRFKSELLYKSAKPWPILDHNGRDMYYMIHATDYPDAPALMHRAYAEAVQPRETPVQSTLWLVPDNAPDPE
jgi:three-Cys-motif partner protein